jgi:hypothetical protein
MALLLLYRPALACSVWIDAAGAAAVRLIMPCTSSWIERSSLSSASTIAASSNSIARSSSPHAETHASSKNRAIRRDRRRHERQPIEKPGAYRGDIGRGGARRDAVFPGFSTEDDGSGGRTAPHHREAPLGLERPAEVAEREAPEHQQIGAKHRAPRIVHSFLRSSTV